MIARQNWKDINSYLRYQKDVLLFSPKTIDRKRILLRHLLEWADETLFPVACTIEPVFPVYLLTARNDGKAVPLSPQGMKRICAEARQFYHWIRQAKPNRYRAVRVDWIATLRPSRAHGPHTQIKDMKAYSLEDVHAICALKPERLIDQRDQAAAAFLFLSGMRIDAFVSLPIDCVDLETLRVKQLPYRGVRTKNHKAAITYLYRIPSLLEIVKSWDHLIRKQLPPDSLWYTYMSRDGMHLVDKKRASENRRNDFARGLKRLCQRAGIRYRSPHSFRHGHGVYGVKNARTMGELKAVSQNMMHSSLMTTDSLYGNLGSEDVRRVITSLGRQSGAHSEVGDGDILRITQVLNMLLKKPHLIEKILEVAFSR